MRCTLLRLLTVALLLCISLTTQADHYKPRTQGDGPRLHSTKYDWSQVAEKLTANCATDYQRIKAIYDWECRTIAYDTSKSIYSADSCYDELRGVCQAYCELFYYIATAAGVKVEIVNGLSKDIHSVVSDEGHAWLFAYTSEDSGILLDPTWGAGTVNDGVFTRNKDHSKWFDTDPEWMILTHFPEQEVYQFLNKPLSKEEFMTMPVANPLWREYGITTHYIFEHLRAGDLVLPKFYNQGEGEFEILEVPLRESLRIGETYTFRIRMKSGRNFIVINRPTYCRRNEWRNEGNGVYSVQFMPRDTTRVTLGLADKERANFWNNVLEWTVEPPTAADWAKVEEKYPLSMPEAKGIEHLDEEGWALAGIDAHRLLQFIREERAKDLPSIHYDKGQRLQIVSVPMTRHLKAGLTYTFSFIPKSGVKWAIVLNEKEWFTEWDARKDGSMVMNVTPATTGSLRLYVQVRDGEHYWSCLDYVVE